ncbi:MAG: hypothetical protein ACLFU8_16035 [Anaerolineales bacterium]
MTRRNNPVLLVTLLSVLVVFTACAPQPHTTNTPLETLVLQEGDLPTGFEIRTTEPLEIDDPAHPLANFPDVDLAGIEGTHYVFALNPNIPLPLLNFAVRYRTPEGAAQAQEVIVENLKSLPNATPIEQDVSDQDVYTATSPSGQGTRVYWSALAENDILILLVMEAADRPEASERAEEIFLAALQILEERISD